MNGGSANTSHTLVIYLNENTAQNEKVPYAQCLAQKSPISLLTCLSFTVYGNIVSGPEKFGQLQLPQPTKWKWNLKWCFISFTVYTFIKYDIWRKSQFILFIFCSVLYIMTLNDNWVIIIIVLSNLLKNLVKPCKTTHVNTHTQT